MVDTHIQQHLANMAWSGIDAYNTQGYPMMAKDQKYDHIHPDSMAFFSQYPFFANHFSNIPPVAPSKPTPPPTKKKPKPVPEAEKDENYRERRRRNNAAAKKSRDIKRETEGQAQHRFEQASKENHMLRVEIANLKAEIFRLQAQLSMHPAMVAQSMNVTPPSSNGPY